MFVLKVDDLPFQVTDERGRESGTTIFWKMGFARLMATPDCAPLSFGVKNHPRRTMKMDTVSVETIAVLLEIYQISCVAHGGGEGNAQLTEQAWNFFA